MYITFFEDLLFTLKEGTKFWSQKGKLRKQA